MGLYGDWTDFTQMERTPVAQKAFWDEYFAAETENYKKILAAQDKPFAGALKDLAAQFDMEPMVFAGFLDGINTSLKTALDIESLEEDSEVLLDVDLEKLYFNMLDAKAEWLYTLEEWEPLLSVERRREITKEFRQSKVFINESTVGRNDPCPCGSGKKYKKCCGVG
ncbi:SEC-C domain-containing protein [Christensenellaceae bacterium OttesenSCG-928-M15]|nr:SEC-C domain-containing protein [Christensenellaceae bacterium OttesenSCG-928-M15]